MTNGGTEFPNRGRMRRSILAGIRFVLICIGIWCVAMIGVRRYVCLGWLIPIRVASESMAPWLLGPHMRATCSQCNAIVRGHSDGSGEIESLRCSNCGAMTGCEQSNLRPGTRVLVDRRAIRTEGVRRFDVIAYDSAVLDLPDAESKHPALATKRVMGLPGETISLLDGDVFANQSLIRKTVRQFSEIAILVHADRFRSAESELRWSSASASWEPTHQGYRWLSAIERHGNDSKPSEDWLAYHHQLLPDVVTARPNFIYDEYPYNQGISRALNRVHDLAISATIDWKGSGSLKVRCPVNGSIGEIHIELDDQGFYRVQLFVDGRLATASSNSTNSVAASDHPQLLVGYWDRQLVCQFGGEQELNYALDSPPAVTSLGDGIQFGISALEFDQFEVTNLRLWRDVYYDVPTDSALAAENRADSKHVEIPLGQLQDDQFLLLGDNVPRSKDARYGPRFGIVQRQDIRGIVMPVR